MTLIEIMVGLVIGMLAVLVIYQVYEVSERYKRNTTASADAQTTGLFTTHFLSREIGNAGAGISVNVTDLEQCLGPPLGAPPLDLRPLPVLIRDSGNVNIPDRIDVYSGAPKSVSTPSVVTPAGGIPVGTPYTVQSPLGFHFGDMIIAIDRSTTLCVRSTVTSVPVVNGATGESTFSHAPIPPTVAIPLPQSSLVVNLGPAASVVRTAFDVAPAATNCGTLAVPVQCVLRTTDLLNAGATPVPLASNIVNLKAQYGIDINGNGRVDQDEWFAAAGLYDWALVSQWNALPLNQIKAVRIGLVVRSDELDPAVGNFTWTLFSCTGSCAVACGGPCWVPLTGTINALPGPPPAGGNYRYRTYETVIPLRNTIWNP